MARMEPLGIHEVEDDIRHLCEEAERQTGTSAGPRTYARNPGTIDPVLRELVRLKIAGLNACRY